MRKAKTSKRSSLGKKSFLKYAKIKKQKRIEAEAQEKIQADLRAQKAELECAQVVHTFIVEHPRYVVCESNFDALLKWLLAFYHMVADDSTQGIKLLYNQGLWTMANLDAAYQDLVSEGKLTLTPLVEEDSQVEAAHSKAATPNPKDLFGSEKVSISKLPFVAVVHGAHAMMDGAEKYGPYNWRDKPVIANIYVDALMRHVMSWFEGQETAGDSKVHHLGHAIACAAILLDAQETGNLIDNRPICGKPDKLDVVLQRLKEVIKVKKEVSNG